jgi:hypothetical protein
VLVISGAARTHRIFRNNRNRAAQSRPLANSGDRQRHQLRSQSSRHKHDIEPEREVQLRHRGFCAEVFVDARASTLTFGDFALIQSKRQEQKSTENNDIMYLVFKRLQIVIN